MNESDHHHDDRHEDQNVDEVAEVLDIGAEEVNGAPEFGANLNAEVILGVGIVKGGVKILLDVEKSLACKEAKIAQGVSQPSFLQ